MAYYLSNKAFDCQYWDRPSRYLFTAETKENLVMECVMACASEGKNSAPYFWMYTYNTVLCGIKNNSLMWVARDYENFHCGCKGCIWGGGDPPVIG